MSATRSATTGPSSTNGAGPALALARPPRHPFVARLAHAVLPELQREFLLTLRVGVMLADGVSREQVARRLGLTSRELAIAVDRLEACVPAIERDHHDLPR